MEATNSATNHTSDLKKSVPSFFGEDFLRFKKHQKFLIFDTETCNLNLVWKKNVPWEYAWMVCTQDEILEKEEYLVDWPEIPISDEAAVVTGYYQKRHKIPLIGKKPDWVLKRFDKLLYNKELMPVAHNGLGFDVYIHNIHRKLMGLPSDYSYINRFLDTNTIARAMKLGAAFPKDRSELLSFQYKMYGNPVRGIKTSIEALSNDYQIRYDKSLAHAAMYDVNQLREILFKLIYQVDI